jgi:uncharacterized protein (DUF1684 family)
MWPPLENKISETETYSKRHFLLIEPNLERNVLIDFNRAHNPFCEYNEK